MADAAPKADGPPPIDAAPPPPPDATPCTGGSASAVDPGTGHCYVRIDQGASWDAARTACQALGMGHHLAAVSSAAENDLITTLAAGAHVWIGGNDRTNEMQYTWADSTEAFVFIKWAAGEPNDDGTEDCVVLRADDGGSWNDTECGSARPSVCERP
jgi:hypothetical protein